MKNEECSLASLLQFLCSAVGFSDALTALVMIMAAEQFTSLTKQHTTLFGIIIIMITAM